MRNFQRKQIWRDVIESKPVLISLGIGILIFAWSVFGLWNKMEDTAKNKKIAENQITSLEQQKEKLTSDINSLNTDEGKEKVFRENFGLAKEGENEIVILDNTNLPAVPAPASSSGFFGFLKGLFK
jgi:cell division protein FtsB